MVFPPPVLPCGAGLFASLNANAGRFDPMKRMTAVALALCLFVSFGKAEAQEPPTVLVKAIA